MQSPENTLDVAIVGAGIGGVTALHYAKRAGLHARAFERQEGVGGLWRQLPTWQDIQIGTKDWTLGDLPLASGYQPDIAANIQAWVDRFDLAGDIALGTPVLRAREADGGWAITTSKGEVLARHLLVASGAHNTPVIPTVTRQASEVREFHSSALREPRELAGRDVIVVGGGASAFDLLDLCFEFGARRVVWVYRGLRWFIPTSKPKTVAGSVRPLAKMQASGMTAAQQSAVAGADMRGRYQKFGLNAILPDHDFDILRDQLIPGRMRMIANYGAIERHHGTVTAIEGRSVTLSGGERVDADLLLWGTGYALDLSYFDSPAISSHRTLESLNSRCGGLVRSLDAANLYLPCIGLDGIGSSPFAYSLVCRSIMAHITGHAQLDLAPVPHKVNHFDLATYLAERDPQSYPPGWREQYRNLALNTPDEQTYPVP